MMATITAGAPQHNRNPTNWVRRGVIIAVALGVAVMVFFVGRYFLLPSAPLPQPTEEANFSVGKPLPAHKAAMVVPDRPKPNATPQDRVRGAANGDDKPKPDPIMDAGLDVDNSDQGGPMVVRRRPLAIAAAGAPELGPDGEPRPPGKEQQKDQFAANFQATHFPTAHAYADKNSFYKISAGRLIHCDTSTWINSQHPGEYNCLITEAIRNDKMSLVLLPKGSHAVGQIRQGIVQGQDRLLAIFSLLRTDDEPEVKVKINSPAADALGSAGIGGTVNDFFWSNLLATSVYAILDTLPLLATNALNNTSHNNNVTEFTQITQPEGNLAGRVLSDRLKRAPILERALPADVVIFVNQDIDFSDAIGVVMRRQHEWAGQ